MEKVVIIRYAEIWLKGKNRGFFERAFETNLARAIKDFTCSIPHGSISNTQKLLFLKSSSSSIGCDDINT